MTLISGEVQGLLTQVALAASLRVIGTPHLAGIRVMNDLPVVAMVGGVMLELGSFYAGETRRLLVTVQIPGIRSLGLLEVARLEFVHVSLPDVVQHTTTVPVQVNVVPGDQAAGRVPNPEVRSEALFQQTQRAKRESSQLLSEGYVGEAAALLRQASGVLRSQSAELPSAMAGELFAEATLMESLAEEAAYDSARAAKASSYDATSKSRNRGRIRAGGRIMVRAVDAAGATLLLEEWEMQQLVRLLPPELQRALRPSGSERPGQTARDISAMLGSGHPAQPFFDEAVAGFTVERA